MARITSRPASPSGTSLPAQTGNGGKFLQTDGTVTSWATAGTSVAFTDKGAWATTTAYVVGDTVTQGRVRYLCATAHTSGTFATDLAAGKWDGTSLALTKADVTGTGLAAADIGAEVSGAGANSRLIQAYGSATSGVPMQPWKPSLVSGLNLWATANFSTNTNGAYSGQTNNTSTLTPSVTGNGTTQAVASRIALTLASNNLPQRFRITATVNGTPPAAGGLRLRIKPINSSGTTLNFKDAVGNLNTTFVEPISLASGLTLSNYTFVYEMDLASIYADSTRATYLEVALLADNTATSGTLSLSNVVVKRVQQVTPQIRCSWNTTGGGTTSAAQLQVIVPAGVDTAGYQRLTSIIFAADGALQLSLGAANAYYESGNSSRFAAPYSGNGRWPNSSLHIGNSDQVISVVKSDNVVPGELRGNTHGGEIGASGTYATDFQVFCDYDDGNGWVGPMLNGGSADNLWRHCYRVKIVASTKMTRSDQGSPFATVAKTFIIYADGTMRYDRTMTFLQDQKVDRWFYHMTSLDANTNHTPMKGKLGRGAQVLANIDTLAYVAPPQIADSYTIATTGGTIPATVGGTAYSVRVTAFDALGGETNSNPYNSMNYVITTAGSTITISWAAVTGANGYAVYFGYPGFERRIATTTSLTYTILGSEVPGQTLPTVNTAKTSASGTLMVSSGYAEWSAYYDTVMGQVYSLAVDRLNIAGLPFVKGIRADLQRSDPAILKNYWLLEFDNGGADLPMTIPSGTVYSSTLWYFYYLPADQTFYEREQTLRAASAAQLPVIYPTT